MRRRKQKPVTRQKEEKKSLKAEVVDSLMLPKDLMLGAVVVNATGREEAYIENYRGIIEYSGCKIKLQTKTCQLEITGSQLYISYYTNDEMKITGRIDNIRYL